jgi:hypothetical protein
VAFRGPKVIGGLRKLSGCKVADEECWNTAEARLRRDRRSLCNPRTFWSSTGEDFWWLLTVETFHGRLPSLLLPRGVSVGVEEEFSSIQLEKRLLSGSPTAEMRSVGRTCSGMMWCTCLPRQVHILTCGQRILERGATSASLFFIFIDRICNATPAKSHLGRCWVEEYRDYIIPTPSFVANRPHHSDPVYNASFPSKLPGIFRHITGFQHDSSKRNRQQANRRSKAQCLDWQRRGRRA